MEKKIKIIDLLNKIANGEEVPKKIKYIGRDYIRTDDDDIKYYVGEVYGELLLDKVSDTHDLRDEVEILDEEDEFEDIEEMNLDIDCTTEWNFGEVYDIVNQLINNQKKIIERLKENE